MNSKWLPWILSAGIVIGGGLIQYVINRVDKTTEVQASFYEKYISRWEYDKDYRGLCSRLDTLDNTVKSNYNKLDEKLDTLLGYAAKGK